MTLSKLIIKLRGLRRIHPIKEEVPMPKEKDFDSHIDKPTQHVTSHGGRYIEPFDFVRSIRGRVLIDAHADLGSSKTEQHVNKIKKEDLAPA